MSRNPDLDAFVAESLQRRHNIPVRHTAENAERLWTALPADMPYDRRWSRMHSDLLLLEPVYLFEHEQLVGMYYLSASEAPVDQPMIPQWYDKATEIISTLGISDGRKGSPGHICWHWERILQRGVASLLQDIENHLKNAATPDKRAFYEDALYAWQAVLKWNEMHVDAMKSKLSTASGDEKARLEKLIRICEHVPLNPARSFHEAMQSFYFQYTVVMYENPYGGNGPGRFDVLMWPFLKADLDAGRITMDEAEDLVLELLTRLEERFYPKDAMVESIVLGGTLPDGSNAVNPLSMLILKVYMGLNQTHPHIYARCRRDDPPEYRKACIDYLRNGKNRAQFYNEEVVLKTIQRSGVPFEDAIDYVAGGCMELSCQGRNSDLNFAFPFNIAKWFEEVFEQSSAISFEELFAEFVTFSRKKFAAHTHSGDITAEMMATYRPTPLISTLVDDCLERGCDQQAGGARYADYGVALMGVTGVVDQLFAINEIVFKQHLCTLPELRDKVYDGTDEAFIQMLRRLPKYGCGSDETNALCQRVMETLCELAHENRTAHGGRMKPMIFNFHWTPKHSAVLKARPDGSRAGEYLGHGMTPAPMGLKNGLSSALRSYLSLDYSCAFGGATSMWDLDPALAQSNALDAIFETMLNHGAMIFQGNMTSVEDLEKAEEHPEDFPPIIVRVGGFSSFFHFLTPAERHEIVKRERHRSM